MPITVLIPYPLRRHSEDLAELAVDGGTIGEALENLFCRLPEMRMRVVNDRAEIHPYLILMHGRDEIPRTAFKDVRVGDGDELSLVPAVEGGSGADVRMKGFRERATVERARSVALDGLAPAHEEIPVETCAGRILAASVTSSVDVPAFDRSAMDGYAIRAEESFGATSYDPVRLRLHGESLPEGLRPFRSAPDRLAAS